MVIIKNTSSSVVYTLSASLDYYNVGWCELRKRKSGNNRIVQNMRLKTNNKNNQTLSIGNGLVQQIKVEETSWHKWVKVSQ